MKRTMWNYLLINMWHYHGPLARYATLWVMQALGMLGTFSLLPRVSNPDMHHDTCVTHVPGSLTSGFLWIQWWGKCSRHHRRIRNPQFYVSGKRPILFTEQWQTLCTTFWRNVPFLWLLWYGWPGPVFCLLLRVSSGCAQPITGQVAPVTWSVIGWA